MKRYNILTDINLKLLNESDSKRMYESDFINEEGVKIESWDMQTELLSEYMKSKGLITLNGEVCHINSFGEEVLEKGGWLQYLKKQNKKEDNNEIKNIRKEVQEEIIRKGTIESFEYGKWGFYLAIIALIVSILTLLLK
ncbi:hypothetical protein K8354_16195 [Polaribacter litorisediminis]|uniref:hypothetical protein n=1 Tax=Polaribacter litorisediminis TaxID=1908341 RepID=UPI001CBCC131|nr:hypothetical protein [Polaribacter litorisediminis]UAM97811.1 hypothetical protein K8354_16195 [Polaribacter litorisediminis]